MRRLIVVGPLPPPHHGVSVSTSLVLANRWLRRSFAVKHFDTSDHRTISNLGRWDARNVVEGVRAVARFQLELRGTPGLVYLPISQGLAGLARDTLLIRSAAMRGWKVVAHLRGSELGAVYRGQPAPIRRWLLASFKRLDSMAIMGDSVRHAVQGLIPAERVAVVPNGTPDPGPIGRQGGEVGLFISNLLPRKGVCEALAAAVEVARQRPQARFVFAGDCLDEPLLHRLQEIARQADGRIELRRPITGEEKRKLFSTSAFLLFPPVEPEGHPRVVLEALAAGLPVITTDRGTIAETVIDGESGFVLAEPEPKALAERVLRLYDDAELRAAMSAAARARYLERFTLDATDRVLAEWLETVADLE